MTKLQNWDAETPYNALPKLPPETELETRTVLKSCIEARAALAELKQAAELIPNQAVLINTIPLLEAKASSEIENIVTTNDALFQYREGDENADAATKEAHRYRQALMEGYQQLQTRPLSTKTTEQICTRIKGIQMEIRRMSGTALAKSGGKVVYTPPEGESLIRDLLANWENFIHADNGLDPLTKLAVSHYQFEAIHPFSDGNGRTGRVLNSLYLIEQRLLTLPILYLSRYIIENKADYYSLLMAVTTSQRWEDWLLYIFAGITQTANWTTAKISAMRELMSATQQYVQDVRPNIYKKELVEVIFNQPYCRISHLVDAKIAERQTASHYLKELSNIGVLRERTKGREKIFEHPRLWEMLTKDKNNFSPFQNPITRHDGHDDEDDDDHDGNN